MLVRKPLDLLDCTGKHPRGQLILAFDWLKVTAGYLDDDHACMVRVKFDEVYVSLVDPFFTLKYFEAL